MKKITYLISAFPGTGKSYCFNNNTTWEMLDSDSSTFDKKDFPDNYIKHIKDNDYQMNCLGKYLYYKEIKEIITYE